MKYKKLTGVILKKQNYKEADQIITLWTREAGKVRVLARSVRLPKAKLCYSVQDLCLVEIDLAGRGNMMTLIGSKIIKQFKNLMTDLPKASKGFYAAELMMKMTADEHPNPQAFDLLVEFLTRQNKNMSVNDYSGVDEFALRLADTLGFGSPEGAGSHKSVKEFIQDLIERELHTDKLLTELIINP